ncbi:MAG: DegV family protein [Chloroflexota bacterium]|nr:DegV family protein [Chloroflexota bacterium]
MERVAIITDSTACLPPELVAQYGIRVLPLTIHFNERAYHDGVDLTPDQFYEMLKVARDLPTTSASSAGEFLAAFREVGGGTRSIVCVLISGNYSATIEAATTAREMAREALPDTEIAIVDGRTTAGALGFSALEAARAARDGADMAQVVARAEETVSKVTFIAVLDTLSYLARGGRIGTAAAWASSLLSIKPIIEVPTTTGYTEGLERARTKSRAIKRLLDVVEERVGSAPLHAMVHHAGTLEEGEALKEQVARRFNCVELYLTPFTPVMGAHTGPGLVGVSFFADK